MKNSDSRPLRILFISSRFPDKSRPNLGLFVERQVRQLADRPSVEIAVIAPIGLPVTYRKTDREWLRALPYQEMWEGISVFRPRYLVVARLEWLTRQMLNAGILPIARRLHAKNRFDIVSAEFAWPDGPAAIALGRRLGIPVSIKARGLDFEGPMRSPWIGRVLRDACMAADGLLAVSEDTKASMVAAGVPAERIHVHYPAVDTDLFRPLDHAEARRALKVDGPVLLCIGNLVPFKRVDLAIVAMTHLPDVMLLIVGNGPEAANLQRLATTLEVAGRVRFLGGVSNASLPAVYAAADVLVHCPQSDGFSNVRLEALACGVPIVTTAVGEARRIVVSAAQGTIVGPDPKQIARAAAQLIASRSAPKLIRAAAEPFSWLRATDFLSDHLHKTADRHGTRPG